MPGNIGYCMTKRANNTGLYYALATCGMEMVAPMILGIILDNWLGTTPIFAAITVVVGFVGGITHMVLISNKINDADRAERLASTLRKDPIELNEFGNAVWRHKTNENLFVERSYRWCDRVVVLDETDGRRVIDDTKFSTFDFSDWIPVGVEEFKKVKQKFKEIYQ